MDDVTACLKEIEKLHENIMTALVNNEAQVVSSLVYQQCAYLSRIQPGEFEARHRALGMDILQKVNLQQTLINQAAEITNYFLVRLHGAAPFEAIG